MDRALAIVVLSVFAGCGSSDGFTPLFGGFIPTGGAAVIFPPAICDIPFVGTTSVAGITIDLTSYADACEVINATQLCGNKASSTRILGMVVSGRVGSDGVEPAGPGTYRYLANPPTGTFAAAVGQAVQDDAACDPLPGTSVLDMEGGSITISTVTQTRVTGSSNMRFEDRQVFTQPFDVAICPATIDLCARFTFCGSHTCVP